MGQAIWYPLVRTTKEEARAMQMELLQLLLGGFGAVAGTCALTWLLERLSAR